ncbi:MAG: NAD(P)H-hydrate dehydratase, partial [Paramuribaculum sp.]|nr:NAD(P)H-hydrate dehydratase [Paramuribaculum sp.]
GADVPEGLFRKGMHVTVNPYTACGKGPGLGTNELTVNAVETFIKSSKNPLVIDADALNAISRRPDLLNSLPANSLLTPHEGEFDRLFGECDSREARLKKAIDTAKYYAVFILLKGRYSALVCPDGKIYFNSSGSVAMATPGSGDVLTGLLTALMAQGYNSKAAAIIGVYIHGLAGQMAEDVQGQYGVSASDIAHHIGPAIKSVLESNKR